MAHDDYLDEGAVPLRAGVLADCVEAEDALDEIIGDALSIRLVEVGSRLMSNRARGDTAMRSLPSEEGAMFFPSMVIVVLLPVP